jgi:hypothetical protein
MVIRDSGGGEGNCTVLYFLLPFNGPVTRDFPALLKPKILKIGFFNCIDLMNSFEEAEAKV